MNLPVSLSRFLWAPLEATLASTAITYPSTSLTRGSSFWTFLFNGIEADWLAKMDDDKELAALRAQRMAQLQQQMGGVSYFILLRK